MKITNESYFMEQFPMKTLANLARIKSDSTYTGPAREMYNETLVCKKRCLLYLWIILLFFSFDDIELITVMILCVCCRIVWASGTKKTSMIQRLPELL